MTTRRASWVLAVVALASCWTTPRPAAPRRDNNFALALDQFELANGLRVVVVPEPEVADVSVTMRYGSGSADDPAGKPGLAHLAEHVEFEQVRDGRPLFADLETRALAFNGITYATSTVYTERAAPDELPDLLAIEAARMAQPAARSQAPRTSASARSCVTSCASARTVSPSSARSMRPCSATIIHSRGSRRRRHR